MAGLWRDERGMTEPNASSSEAYGLGWQIESSGDGNHRRVHYNYGGLAPATGVPAYGTGAWLQDQSLAQQTLPQPLGDSWQSSYAYIQPPVGYEDFITSNGDADPAPEIHNSPVRAFAGVVHRAKHTPMSKEVQAKTIEDLQQALKAFEPLHAEAETNSPKGAQARERADSGWSDGQPVALDVLQQTTAGQTSPEKSAKKRTRKVQDVDLTSPSKKTKRMDALKQRHQERKQEQKEAVAGTKPEIKQVLSHLQSIRDQHGLVEIVKFASDALNDGGNAESVVKNIAQIDFDWRTSNEEHFNRLCEFLERHGVLPIGAAGYKGD